ncbi:hypothetical protein DL93DRAFT_2233835 [Clavulina sp. PMI_390]|nr:hypothetical protein DL93DRAFT_2233835 [Clavulina sp. PMI_390]
MAYLNFFLWTLATGAVLVFIVIVIPVVILPILFSPPSLPSPPPTSTTALPHFALEGSAYIINGSTSHVRYLPSPSHHAFTYPTFSFLVSLRALERGELDMNIPIPAWAWGLGWVAKKFKLFAWNPKLRGAGWWCLTSLQGESYLQQSSHSHSNTQSSELNSIVDKILELVELASTPSFPEGSTQLSPGIAARIGEIWTMTMPSFLGFAGINPLTVHFCYEQVVSEENAPLLLVVLEVHNTFGERHVYFLEVGNREDPDEERQHGFAHQWTIPRQFHVSPFNDRKGHYVCSINAPQYPPHHPHWRIPRRPNIIPNEHHDTSPEAPRVSVKITYVIDSTLAQSESNGEEKTSKEKKFMALHRAIQSTPLSPRTLALSLLHAPLILFMTFPRIAYEAFKLHYFKGLDVYSRPEPVAGSADVDREPTIEMDGWNEVEREGDVGARIRTIGTQPPKALELRGHELVRAYLSQLELVRGSSASSFESTAIDNDSDGDKSMGLSANTFVVELVSTRIGEPAEIFTIPIQSQLSSSSTTSSAVLASSSPLRSGESLQTTSASTQSSASLRITYSSPRIFTILLLSPTSRHALLAAVHGDRIMDVSSDEAFCKIFANFADFTSQGGSHALTRYIKHIRAQWAAGAKENNLALIGAQATAPSPAPRSSTHLTCVARSASRIERLSILTLAISLTFFLTSEYAEERVFHAVRARFVPGDAPWAGDMWNRAAASLAYLSSAPPGFIYDEKAAAGKWGHLDKWRPSGSVRRA